MRLLTHFLKWQCGLAQAETQTTAAERDCLVRHAAGRRILVEVGVWHGVTTCRLRSAMAYDAVLYAIDPYHKGRLGLSFPKRIAQAEVGRIPNGRVEWIRMTGVEAARHLAPQLAGRVEFLFLDGDHSYDGLKGDWLGWRPLLAPRGIVGLHDSRSTPQRPIEDAGSVRFTREVILRDANFERIDEVDSLTVLRRVLA